MRRYKCTVTLTVTFQDNDVEDSEAQDLIQIALKKLHPSHVEFEDIEEIEPNDEDEEEEINGILEYVDDEYIEEDMDDNH